MAFFKSLFGKKNDEESDGQEEYFREDFDPVAKKPSAKKSEPKVSTDKSVKTEKKPAVKKAEPKPAVKAERSVEKKIAPKSTASKKTTAKSTPPSEVKKTVKTEKASTAKKGTAKVVKTEKAKVGKEGAKAPSRVKELRDDSPEVKGAVSIQESSSTENGKWDIRKAKDGRYFFSLYASNHTVIAYSQIYSSSSAVMTGINSVIANAPKCEIEDTTLKKVISLPYPKWEIYLDKAGEYRFRLYAHNGLVICHSSHGYSTKSGCKGGIDSIRRFCVEARVNKSYKQS